MSRINTDILKYRIGSGMIYVLKFKRQHSIYQSLYTFHTHLQAERFLRRGFRRNSVTVNSKRVNLLLLSTIKHGVMVLAAKK